jgi:ParB-like nuclease domain
MKPSADEVHPNTPKIGQIVDRPPGELKPWPGNPRTHSDKQLAKLKASIQTFGFTAPVLVDEAGVILSGRFQHRDRQRYRSPRADEALSARRLRISWPFLADVHRTDQVQPLESGPIPLRIDSPARPLGDAGHGCFHPPHRRLRRRIRLHRWRLGM